MKKNSRQWLKDYLSYEDTPWEWEDDERPSEGLIDFVIQCGVAVLIILFAAYMTWQIGIR